LNNAPTTGATTGQGGSPTLGDTTGTSATLSQTELGALSARIKECWDLLPFEQGSLAKVVINIRLNQDGTLQQVPQIVSVTQEPEAIGIAQKSVRAVQACAPYTMLSPASYGQWQNLNLEMIPASF